MNARAASTPSARAARAPVRALAFALACAALALSPPAAAQAPSDLERLLRSGYELRRRGQDEAALDVFREAFTVSQEPRVAAQLGLAEQAVGLWVAAEQHLQQALASTTDRWVRRNRGVLADALEVVLAQLAVLEVRVRPPEARVSINGDAASDGASNGGAFRVAAGVVRLEVSAEGYQTVTRSVEVTARSTMRETIELRPAEPPAPPPTPAPPAPVVRAVVPPPPPPRVVRPRRWVLRTNWTPARRAAVGTLAALGVATAGLGVVALILRDDAAGQYNEQCPELVPGVMDSSVCAALRRAEPGWAATAAVALGASAALAVGALLVGLTVPRVRVPIAAAVTSGGIFLALRVGD